MAAREQTWDLLEEALTEIVYTRDAPPGERFQLDRHDQDEPDPRFRRSVEES